MRMVTYAVGDVHGRRDLLDAMLGMIERDASARGVAARIVFTGDYVDRGARSHDVVERLIEGPSREGDAFVCLGGNHDDLFVRAATTGDGVPDWAWFLFRHTLRGYERDGVLDRGALARHVRFLAGLPLFRDDGRYLFVHAGIRPGVRLEDQLPEELIWIREPFLQFEGDLGRIVVHGHTIMGDRPVVTPNRISIDTGAYRSGILTAAVLDGGAPPEFLRTAGEPDAGAVAREAELRARLEAGGFGEGLDREPPLAGWAGR